MTSSAAGIGINLANVTYWSTEEPFIDRMHSASGWSAKDAAGNDISSTLPKDKDGDFSSLKGVTTLVGAVGVDPKAAAPIDQYVLTYTGTASVSIAGAKILSQTAGKVVFEYTSDTGNNYVQVKFNSLSATNPVHDVHVVRADQQTLFNSGEIFNPAFIAKVSQWGMVRFMDWGNTNSSKAVTWDTRDTLSSATWSQSAHADGVPIEVMVKLANEAHVDMWYNVPTKADDTYVRNALTYIRDHLDPTLKVHVEYSNEVWNTGFAANSYAQTNANSLWGNGGTVKNGAMIYYGYRSAQIANIGHQVFTGTHASQLSDVLAGQIGNTGMLNDWKAGAAKAGFTGPITNLFHEWAVAPYFGGEIGTSVDSRDLQTILGWAKSGSAGLNAAFHELEFGGTLSKDYSLAHEIALINATGKAALANGLKFDTYEAGTSFSTTHWAAADKAAVQDLFNRLLADPRMADLYTKEIAAFKAAGGSTFTIYNDVGAGGDSGTWGALTSIYADGSQRYNAWLASAVQTTVSKATSGVATHDAVPTSDPDTNDVADGGDGSSGAGTNTNSGGGTSADAGGDTGTDTPTAPTTGTDAPTTEGHAAAAPPITGSGHISGTSGDDHINASSQNDTIDGAGGNDMISGSSSSHDAHGNLVEADCYMGGAGADTIVGGDGNDHIFGNEVTTSAGSVDGADVLSGGGGSDYIQGNAGDDTIDGGAGADRLYGGAGNDSILGGDGNDYLQGNKGSDTLSGGIGDDTVHGGADNDKVSGDAGNDQVFGDAGNDTLIGGLGIDKMTGGAGSDTFVFSGHDAAFATSGAAAWQTDEVLDFAHGSDKFHFDFTPMQVLGGSAVSASAALTMANSILSAHHGDTDVAAITVGNDTYLFWDASGQGGSADSAVKVDHVHDTFTLADFG